MEKCIRPNIALIKRCMLSKWLGFRFPLISRTPWSPSLSTEFTENSKPPPASLLKTLSGTSAVGLRNSALRSRKLNRSIRAGILHSWPNEMSESSLKTGRF